MILLCVSPALAQDRVDFPVEGGAIIIEGRNIQVFQDGTVQVVGGNSVHFDPIATNEELSRVSISDELLGLTLQLDHADYEVRERATQAIIDMPGDNVQIYALLARRTLSAEQHYRLIAAVRERLLNAPRGALGISMTVDRPDIVEVIDLLPGLPAEKVLKVGDRIIAIDEHPIAARTDLTLRIQARRPGENVALTILRPRRDEQGKPLVDEQGAPVRDQIDVTVTLGSADMLRDPITGRSQVNPQVEQQRQMEANAVGRRFRIEPTQLVLAGEIPAPRRSEIDRQVDELLESHPAIRFLLRYREHVAARGGQIEPGIIEQTLHILRMEMQNPNLSQEDRTLLERVIERYLELMHTP